MLGQNKLNLPQLSVGFIAHSLAQKYQPFPAAHSIPWFLAIKTVIPSLTAKKDTSIMSSHIEFLVWHNLTQIKNDFPKIYGMPKSLGGLYQIYSFFMTHMSSLRAGITSKSTAESSFSVQTVFKKKKKTKLGL